MPQRTPKPEYNDCFDDGAAAGDNASGEEDLSKVVVICGVHAIQDDGHVRPELGNYIKRS